MTKSELRVVVCLLFVFQINAQDTCTAEGELFLVTTNINAEVGDLLICEDGVFIGVCTLGFNNPESRAACRQLGFVDGVDDGGTNVENSDFSTKRFRCTGAVVSLTDGSCTITNNTQSCSTRARVACSNSFVSTLSLSDGQVFNLPPDMETLMINFDAAIPVGFDEYSVAFAHPTGYMQFGSPPLDYDILSINDSPPPVSLIYPFAPLDGYDVVSLTATVFKNPGLPILKIVSRYINSNIAIGFTAQLLILTQWTYEDVYIVQSAVVTDFNSTFVVYIYNCAESYQTGGLIGVHINGPGFIDQKFRYSNTPMTSQLACINIAGRNIRFYNLHYFLTEDLNVDSPIPPPAPDSDQPFCARFLNSAGCCSNFNDPTTSCATGSDSNTCYCDALCFQRNDCCSDVELIVNNIEACIPLCIEGTVGLAGNILYSTGPVGVCDSGYMRFISEEGSLIQRTINENTTCLQMYNQIDGNFDDFTNEQINMNVYPVYRENVVCSGTEENIQDCQFIDDVETTDISTFLLTVNCLDAPAPVCINGEITLVQSESIEGDLTTQGIVEICLFGQRQRLCVMDDIVDNVRNLCRFLGFNTTEQSIAFLEDIVSFGITSIDCPDVNSTVSGCTIEYGSCQDLLILALSCSDDDPLNLVEGSRGFVLGIISIAAIAISVGFFTIISCILILVTIMITVCVMRKRNNVKSRNSSNKEEELPLEEKRYVSQFPLRRKGESMGSTHLLDDISDDLILPNSQLRLLDCVGQGEFGLVYKAHYLRGANADYVAVKTLKGVFDKNEIDDMLKESLFMKKLDHPNVMQLLGVCLDTGSSPYIVLPFMSGGSLLHYLKKYRTNLLEPGEPNTDAEENEIKLLSMCLQVARGMEYIAGQNLVHRDLAARNCMIDHEGTIKVSDFGLSTGLYEKMYFRQEKTDSVKLPIKWMAMESIEDGIFSEKSDVWSFGVTCWEVFSGGKTPFGGIIPFSIPKLLLEGHRLERPYNTACSIKTYQSLMTNCWIESPDNRPQFTDLVQTIDEMLTSMAGYLDFNTFNLNVINNSNDDTKTPIDTEDEAELTQS